MSNRVCILMAFTMLIGAALTSNLLYIKNASNTNQMTSSNPIVFGSGEVRNLTLNTMLPNDTPSMKIYNLLVPQFNLSYCKNVVNNFYPEWLGDDVKVNEIYDDDNTFFSTCFVKGNETIRIYKSGALEYFNRSAQQKWRDYWTYSLTESKSSDGAIFNTSPPGNASEESSNSDLSQLSDNAKDAKKNETSGRGVKNINGTENNGAQTNSSNNNDTTKNETPLNGCSSDSKNETVDNNYSSPSRLVVLDNQISSAEAYNRSIEYIKAHGGLPKDFYLFWNGTAVILKETPKVMVIAHYIFCFGRKVDGYPVLGAGGDFAKLVITPLGDVELYLVLWRELGSAEKSTATVSASQALECLDKNVHGHFTIERVELGYYSAASWETQTKMTPVWIFYTSQKGRKYFCVDAVESRFCD